MGKNKASKPAIAKRAASSAPLGSVPDALMMARRPVLWLIAIYVTFKWFLPFLAEMTPPGVDVKVIQREAELREQRSKDKCATVCDGMTCPDGWTTGRSPEDRCKCICVRKDPATATQWDKEHNQAQHFAKS